MKKVSQADSYAQRLYSNDLNLRKNPTEKEDTNMKLTTAKGPGKMLKTLQEAREGLNEFIDPTKSQEILDEYFFGKSMRKVKRLLRSSVAQGKNRTKSPSIS